MEKTLPQNTTRTGDVLKKGAKPEYTDVPEQKADHAATSIGKRRASRGGIDQNSFLPSQNGEKPKKCSFVAKLFGPQKGPQSLHCRTSPQTTSSLSVLCTGTPPPPTVYALPLVREEPLSAPMHILPSLGLQLLRTGVTVGLHQLPAETPVVSTGLHWSVEPTLWACTPTQHRSLWAHFPLTEPKPQVC